MSAPSERPPRAHDHALRALNPSATSVDQPPTCETPRTAAELVEYLRALPPSEESARAYKLIEASPWRNEFCEARKRNLIPHAENNASSVAALIERVASAYFDRDARAAGSQEIGQLFKLAVAIDDDRRCREYGGLVHNFIILLQEIRDWLQKTGTGLEEFAERPTQTTYGAVARKRFLDDARARSTVEIRDKLLPLTRADGYDRYVAHCNRRGLDLTDPDVMAEMRDFAVYPDADWLSLTLDRMMDAIERNDAENPPVAGDAPELPQLPDPIAIDAEAESPKPAALGLERAPTLPVEHSDLVTLNQAAAMVHKSKRTLERYKTKGTLPDPVVEGGGGRSALYDWRTLRPWLVQEFGVDLPEIFPASRRS